jgi:hypothetical protein
MDSEFTTKVLTPLLMSIDIIKDITIPLLSVFLGAYFAYKYQERSYKKRKHDEEVENITKAYLLISNQLNDIVVITKQFCEDIVTDTNINAIKFEPRESDRLEPVNLANIALRDGNLYSRMQESDAGYHMILHLIAAYNIHIDTNNEFYLINTIGAILQTSLDVIDHDKIVLNKITEFVKTNYKIKTYLSSTITQFEESKVLDRIEKVHAKITRPKNIQV